MFFFKHPNIRESTVRFVLNLLLCIAFVHILCIPALAQQKYKQDKITLALEANSEKIITISSEFTQQSYISLFEDTIISKGKFAFAKPNYLRWEYLKPFASGFIIKGENGLRWDESDKNSTTFNIKTSPEMEIVSQQILAWTTMNMAWLKSVYNISITSDSPIVMELTPKSTATREFLNQIIVFFSNDKSHLTALELHEPCGDYTRIEFSKVLINTNLPPKTFTSH